MDVGCGLGESVRLWKRRYNSSPDSLGVNISPAEVDEAWSRGVENIIVGDAAELPASDSSVDAVLAVDSAYHFRPSRLEFFRETFRILRPGGVFGAADIVAGGGDTHSWRRLAICGIVGIPHENVISIESYKLALSDAGLSERVSVRDVTEHVTGGFSNGAWTTSWTVRSVAWLLGRFMEHADLRFIIVAARKPRATPVP